VDVAQSVPKCRIRTNFNPLFLEGKAMPIEIRRDHVKPPQVTREQPGLRFTDANFASKTIACGFANIFERYPSEGFSCWDGDMAVYLISGYLTIEEKGEQPIEVCPGNAVLVTAGTPYRWRQMNDDDVLVFVVNPLPFNQLGC
jgi:uncharacterized cupin superfamily protein